MHFIVSYGVWRKRGTYFILAPESHCAPRRTSGERKQNDNNKDNEKKKYMLLLELDEHE